MNLRTSKAAFFATILYSSAFAFPATDYPLFVASRAFEFYKVIACMYMYVAARAVHRLNLRIDSSKLSIFKHINNYLIFILNIGQSAGPLSIVWIEHRLAEPRARVQIPKGASIKTKANIVSKHCN